MRVTNVHIRCAVFLLLMLQETLAFAQFTLAGKVVDEDGRPIGYAYVAVSESGQWAMTDDQGSFRIKDVVEGKLTLAVQCLGYQKRTLPMNVTKNVLTLRLVMKEDNLRLSEVTVVAKRKTDEATTSYTIDRTALENQQIVNVSDIGSLLPGGTTVNPSLMNDNRLALRSASSEGGNASFGTAIELDGVRLNNNAETGESRAASTRMLSASNIESIEVIAGVPSVEYGDLSNGIVKVNTRRGKSPFVIEGRINQHTRQIAVNKGFDMGRRKGVLNASFEHARSFSNAASPYTAYQRNILSLNYMNTFLTETTPLTLNVGFSGNIGGYNSKADPDQELDDYNKVRDNRFQGNFQLQWLLNKRWLTNVSLKGAVSTSDHRSEAYSHTSSASTQPYLHGQQEGYFMAADYNTNPYAEIILGPTGYWYVKSYNDSKPLNWSLNLKGEWSRKFGAVRNFVKVGADYTGSRNTGRGTYYDDMRYAPTWREYRYDALPTLHNLAFYAEEKVSIPTARRSVFELTAGLRNDQTLIGGSDYGTVSSWSPRANARYVFWRNQRKRWVSELQVHAGWGKSVKLPSFQVLYPTPGYADRLAFASTSTSDNRSYMAYHIQPSKALYNPDLRWQYTHQTDIGVKMTLLGTQISLSGFYHRTHRPYMLTDVYRPMTYRYTPPSSLDVLTTSPDVSPSGVTTSPDVSPSGVTAADDRRFTIDRQTGIVTAYDASGATAPQQLAYTERNTYAVSDQYVNGTPITRYGLEWTIDFTPIKPLRTSIRVDGRYYHYKGLNETLFADIPLGANSTMSGNRPYAYVGWYRGYNATSTGYSASASVTNGSISRQLNLNATITTHIPQIRLIVALRIESSLYRYNRSLCEFSDGTRGIVLADKGDLTGVPYDGSSENRFVALYPEYYSTWDNPGEKIPFAEKFLWAKDNDPTLYSDLSQLVVKTNYAYTMNPDRISAYYSANLSVTKEIGDHVSVSFYANNFFNTMRKVHSSQNDLETSLFSSAYVPSYYYGLSLKLKL